MHFKVESALKLDRSSRYTDIYTDINKNYGILARADRTLAKRTEKGLLQEKIREVKIALRKAGYKIS